MSIPCSFPQLSLPFVTALPPVPCTVTLAVVHLCEPLTTKARGKVAGSGGVLLVGLEIRGPACVCCLCCFVQDLGICRNC